MDKYLNENPVVSMKNISKSFGDKKVLSNVNFDLHKSEVHALLGENGAGKTTLMNILYGMFPPSEGSININGKTYTNMTPKMAIDAGIGMVHQHFMLIEPLTVTENIILGYEEDTGLFLDRKTAREKIEKLSEEYGLMIDPNAKVEDISVGQQQRVEILKALYRGADILIFDEPTAVLTPQEINEFIEIINKLTRMDKSIIIITHKLAEIKAMADHCTIIRRGEYIDKLKVKEVDENILAEKMVGRNVSFNVDKKDQEIGGVVLNVEDLWAKDRRGVDILKGLDLEIRAGEILGIAGVDGNGQTELIDCLTGMAKANRGTITLNGKDITNTSPRNILDTGMNSIPEDRQKRGLVLEYPIKDNFILENVEKEPFSTKGKLNFKNIDENAHSLVEKFDVRPNDINEKAVSLSGGNQQKVVFAKWYAIGPEILILDEPTKGVDVGAKREIYDLIKQLTHKGVCIILISSDLPELLSLSDRIYVIHEGKVNGELLREEADQEKVMTLATGGNL